MTDIAIKNRIRDFYDSLSPHFRDMWGEHLHDGYYEHGDETKEIAQEKLVAYLAKRAQIPQGKRGLDIGCGMGATSVWLARHLGCHMTGITLSSVQVEIAQQHAEQAGVEVAFKVSDADTVTFDEPFDFLWMVGVLGHLPNQHGFLNNSPRLIKSGGRFLLADWVIAPDVSEKDKRKYVDPVLEGMLMPDVASVKNYVNWFEESGYNVISTEDIANATRKTWDEGISITQTPTILQLALELGSDALGLLSAIKGMRKAMDRGLIGYGVVVAEKR
ncbi:class I SAM-dependent methyltransferase [Rubellicoccus peritrichatus]|uniref:Class I SAM-dependent methyltransferase n=1 Tax=Rubellicoccus peritrichatus TaxID=3080537 RepID=A0AAQ3QU60_9BACT|nr:class I SAM-dependent methyltransferase [Puniceicoccus sp. CR14]WOO39302.1 class I SAM-dependent methyltransferase [Puniceicoccus sp. CR14]